MKKIYLLPNLVTTANIVCGFLAMIHSINGNFTRACWFIIIAAICDSLDGRIARLARAESSFGVQYDSLSDLTSFGIAPAIMMFTFALHNLQRVGISIAAFYAVCAALRLARFNVTAEETPAQAAARPRKIRKGYFQGLPSPASAGLIVTTVMIQNELSIFSDTVAIYFIAVLGPILAALMISNIPFPSFKEVNWRAKGKAWILLIPVAFILSVIQAPEITLFSVGYFYLVCSIAWASYLCWVRDKKSAVGVVNG
jgi:CDP-diacylglycerol--serine O-phosphatidyltransferase